MGNKVKFDISTTAILKVVFIVLLVWFFYAIRDIVFLFFIVLIIVAAINPLVNKMSKYMPRIISLVILTLVLVGLLTALGFLIIPPVVNQLGQISVNLPILLNKLGPLYQTIQDTIANYQKDFLNVSTQLARITSGIYSTTIGFIGGIVAFLTVLVLSFYMLLEENSIKSLVHQLVPLEHKQKVIEVIKKIGLKMGSWLRGQILLMIIIGVLDGIALVVLDMPYALTLAVWGGFTEVIPYIGPWLGLIPAAIIAFTISPLTGVLVILIYLGIQQLEAQFLAPKIMGRAVGLSPVIIILAILIGAKLEGILGVLVAVPIAGAVSVIIQEWPELRKLKSNS